MQGIVKGSKIAIKGNSVLSCMGIATATGIVFTVRPGGVAFKCDQTGAIETADFDDGDWCLVSN